MRHLSKADIRVILSSVASGGAVLMYALIVAVLEGAPILGILIIAAVGLSAIAATLPVSVILWRRIRRDRE